MRIRPLFALVIVILLAGIAAYVGWAVHAVGRVDRGWAGLDSAWPFILAGVATVAVVLGGFVWLALTSERKSYDERAGSGGR